MGGRPHIPTNCYFQGCYNPELEQEIKKCKEKCFRYNQLSPVDLDAQRNMLAEILGEMGDHVIITPPFWCDYGYHIKIGNRFYANHNMIITDGANVTFGDDVWIAPNCCFTTAEHAVDPEQRKAGIEVAKPDHNWKLCLDWRGLHNSCRRYHWRRRRDWRRKRRHQVNSRKCGGSGRSL